MLTWVPVILLAIKTWWRGKCWKPLVHWNKHIYNRASERYNEDEKRDRKGKRPPLLEKTYLAVYLFSRNIGFALMYNKSKEEDYSHSFEFALPWLCRFWVTFTLSRPKWINFPEDADKTWSLKTCDGSIMFYWGWVDTGDSSTSHGIKYIRQISELILGDYKGWTLQERDYYAKYRELTLHTRDGRTVKVVVSTLYAPVLRKYPRLPFTLVYPRFDATTDSKELVIDGKGENEWDCEDEIMDNLSMAANTHDEAAMHFLTHYYYRLEKRNGIKAKPEWLSPDNIKEVPKNASKVTTTPVGADGNMEASVGSS